MTRKRIKRKKLTKEGIPSEKEVKLVYKPTSKARKRRGQSGSGIPTNLILGIVGVVIVVIVAGIIAVPVIPNQNGNPEEYQIPYSVTTIHDETIQLSSYQGKSFIIYFSGVHCVPCQQHLPNLVDAYDYYKTSDQIDLVSLDIGGSLIGELLVWEQDNDINWKVCQDSGLTLATYFSVFSMPTLVVCDENGYELNRYVGTQDNETIWAIFESAIS